jgi:hypothetical protein
MKTAGAGYAKLLMAGRALHGQHQRQSQPQGGLISHGSSHSGCYSSRLRHIGPNSSSVVCCICLYDVPVNSEDLHENITGPWQTE